MVDVAIISYAQTPQVRDAGAQNDIELVMNVVNRALDSAGMNNQEIDFVCSGSCDCIL